MTFETTAETAMTAAIYAALGQTVTYKSLADGSSTIYAIISDGSAPFAFANESQTAERDVSARVKVSDVSCPRRGDTITQQNGFDWYVDSYSRENDSEWSLQLRPCDV